MGYNITIGVLPGTSVDALPLAADVLSFDEASSFGSPSAAAQVGEHAVVVDTDFGEVTKQLAGALGSTAYIVMFGSTADMYVLQTVGAAERLRVEAAGEVVENKGDPLPAEAALASADFPEDRHLALLEALLGEPFEAIWQAGFRPLAVS
ncbi:hypothetical protein [Microbacterium sp. JZ31]|uniref:hypothetical protein n=1 Tax=Microbacterium sp. JZ31 TaxID=1906274 RepID=UPI0019326B22|nr:hypothetical protein [Microbacterium sp. JZ31]